MKKRFPAPSYTLSRINQALGPGRGVVKALVAAGLVTPESGTGRGYRFSFQDMVLLRTAHRLRQSNITPRQLLRSLRRIRADLPDDKSLSAVRMDAVGNRVAIGDGEARWDAESGQVFMEFEEAGSDLTVAALNGQVTSADSTFSESYWHNLATDLEAEGDVAGAEKAYRQALAIQPNHEVTYVNLGAMLCINGRYKEAVELYEVAVLRCPESAQVHFNRGLALEDHQQFKDALASYERSLTFDPTLADAHFNAARLHNEMGEAQGAIRHYSAYRRLTQ